MLERFLKQVNEVEAKYRDESLVLGKYEAIFRENDIDETVLPHLTADDLKEVGVASWRIAASCSTPSLLCVAKRAVKAPSKLPPWLPQASPSKTVPSAVR
jgi:SAM domain (Sterile alpha motif)